MDIAMKFYGHCDRIMLLLVCQGAVDKEDKKMKVIGRRR